MRELNVNEVEQVSGGMRLLVAIGGWALGHVAGKMVDSWDRSMSSPGTEFNSTPWLDAVAAGNMGA